MLLTGFTTLKFGAVANTLTFVATSAAGIETTVTRTVNLDTKPPVITEVSITPNPADAGGTFVLSVTVTD